MAASCRASAPPISPAPRITTVATDGILSFYGRSTQGSTNVLANVHERGRDMSRVALITGGTRGIGYALAEALLQAGDQVAITGTTADSVVRAEHALTACGDGQVAGIVCDVRDPASAELAVETGGREVRRHRRARQQRRRWRRRADRRHVARRVGPHHRHQPHRRVQLLQGGAFRTCAARRRVDRQHLAAWRRRIRFAGGAAYCASKAGLNAFSEALMQELRDDNIRVTYDPAGLGGDRIFRPRAGVGADWKLLPEDVAQAIVDVLNHPARSLPSRIEIRPSRPKKVSSTIATRSTTFYDRSAAASTAADCASLTLLGRLAANRLQHQLQAVHIAESHRRRSPMSATAAPCPWP